MSFAVHPKPRGFGAAVTGIRLSDPISASLADELLCASALSETTPT
jgi:hypothetical protein